MYDRPLLFYQTYYARFEQSIANLSEDDQVIARQLQSDLDDLLGDGDCSDLSDADKAIYDGVRDQLKELQRQVNIYELLCQEL